MAAITAGREGAPAVVLDGAKVLGAKILVSGGGRCNVTHDAVTEGDYAGSTPPAIRRVLRRFDVPRTIAFFADLGVTLKREETGKLFPTTDSSRTVLEALLRAARAAGAEIRHPWRIEAIAPLEDGAFCLSGPAGSLEASCVILATGGRSLPRSGSDGAGLEVARHLGHHVTPRVVPALVGLTVAPECFVRQLSGIAVDARLEVRSGTGRRLARMEESLLCTHFGLSGPLAMDISRHWQLAVAEDAAATLVVSWVPEQTDASLDAALRDLGGTSVHAFLASSLPARLARALCDVAGVAPTEVGHTLRREARRALVRTLLELPVPVTGTRGWNHAEATAGGIPLGEVHLDTLESRVVPGLYLCGEILDVDGRIGGFNFQWAWASGYVAGLAAARRGGTPR
ncbi:MAG: aminoacetone oxidase family FAD-binding enzyme [Dehalococcoidia bacterium]|nr:aminoacetone oxidase family FAD-binding enzyme [Dehalococcoidia bacterium]